MHEQPWQTLSSREIYQNPWTRVREDLVQLPDGRTTIYGVVIFGECVGILPLADDGRVLLVRQYRYVQGAVTWEMPTGGVRMGESLEDAARRELVEEGGLRAARLTHLSTYHTSKSVVRETAHLYLAEGLTPVEAHEHDATEFIATAWKPFEEVLGMVLGNEIVDSMTVIAVLVAARRLGL
ncbi:MAG TPA: NUDIX hydrolase [Chloroflexota bacterium]|jgi:ADP-ribose pyrophosphatase|nr:NUDIX hydrolase [Chloroflexota bacterium]